MPNKNKNEIDTVFRIRSRVVLGHKCSQGTEIKVRDYTYHPEYVRDSFSALAMVQLETDHVKTGAAIKNFVF